LFGEEKILTFKLILGLTIAILLFIWFFWLKSEYNPRQTFFALSRLLTRENTNFSTRNYKHLDTEHFVIKYEETNLANAPIVAEAAEKIYQPVTSMFGFEPPHRTLVVLYPDSVTLAKSFGWDKDERAMGVYWGGSIRLLNPDEWITEGDKRKIFIKDGPMAHEFAHLLVDYATRGNYPRWYTEGVAQYVEKKITGFEFFNPVKYNLQSVEYYDFATLERDFDQLDSGTAYWQCLKATELIAERYGEDKIFAILDYLGRGNSMTVSFRLATGQPFVDFERELFEVLSATEG